MTSRAEAVAPSTGIDLAAATRAAPQDVLIRPGHGRGGVGSEAARAEQQINIGLLNEATG